MTIRGTKLSLIFIAFLLYISLVSAQNLNSNLCGGLHDGVNPCKESGHAQPAFVKSQRGRNQLIFIPQSSLNQVSNKVVSRTPTVSPPSRVRRYQMQKRQSSPSRSFDASANYGLNINARTYVPTRNRVQMEKVEYTPGYPANEQQEVRNINSNVRFAPRFQPIGDLCTEKRKPGVASRVTETMIITPADQPKINCLTETPSVSSPPSPNSNFITGSMIPNYIISENSAPKFYLPRGGSNININNNNKRLNGLRVGSIPVGRTFTTNAINNVRFGITPNINTMNNMNVNTNLMNPNAVTGNTMNRSPSLIRGGFTFGGNTEIATPLVITNPGTRGVTYRPPSRISSVINVQPSNVGNSQPFTSDNQENGMSLDDQESIYKGETHPHPLGPADPVSVAISFKKMMEPIQNMVRTGGATVSSSVIPEDKLSFGPQKIPINGQVQPTFKEIPEEKLHITEKPVVELKVNPASPQGLEQALKPAISYSDLGYAPVAPKPQVFIPVSRAQQVVPQQEVPHVAYFEQPMTTNIGGQAQSVPVSPALPVTPRSQVYIPLSRTQQAIPQQVVPQQIAPRIEYFERPKSTIIRDQVQPASVAPRSQVFIPRYRTQQAIPQQVHSQQVAPQQIAPHVEYFERPTPTIIRDQVQPALVAPVLPATPRSQVFIPRYRTQQAIPQQVHSQQVAPQQIAPHVEYFERPTPTIIRDQVQPALVAPVLPATPRSQVFIPLSRTQQTNPQQVFSPQVVPQQIVPHVEYFERPTPTIIRDQVEPVSVTPRSQVFMPLSRTQQAIPQQEFSQQVVPQQIEQAQSKPVAPALQPGYNVRMVIDGNSAQTDNTPDVYSKNVNVNEEEGIGEQSTDYQEPSQGISSTFTTSLGPSTELFRAKLMTPDGHPCDCSCA